MHSITEYEPLILNSSETFIYLPDGKELNLIFQNYLQFQNSQNPPPSMKESYLTFDKPDNPKCVFSDYCYENCFVA